MSRSYRLIIWLAGIVALLGVSYACLPMILTGLVKYTLSARGLNDVEVSVGYPDWRGIRLHKLQYTVIAGKRHIFSQLTDVDIEYHVTDLLAGTVARVRVPVAGVRVHPATDIAPSVESIAALPLAALVSGQWLSQLPVREVVLEQLTVDWRTPSDTVYTFQVTGNIRDAVAQLNGKINLPMPQNSQFMFSLNARKTGEARLSLSPVDNAAEPLLDLAVSKIAINQNQIELYGALNAKLDTLLPVLQPWLALADWTSGLAGDLNSQWQAQVKDSHWQAAGEARVHGLRGRWREQSLPPGELAASFEVDPQRATVQTTVRAADDAVVLDAKGMHQFATSTGHADLKLMPVMFSDAGFVLSRLLKEWPYSVEISAGRVSGNVRLVWQQAVDLHGIVHLDKLGGHYKQVAFAGLNGKVALEWVNSKGEGLRTSKDAKLHVDVVDVGFPVEKIDVRFALVPHPKTVVPLVRVHQFSAQLLGGQAHSGPFELDFDREKNTFVVQLEQIGLNEIMKLEQQEGLAGSGMLDGQIPLEISSDGIMVKHGQLSARSPGGNIRYTPTAKVAALAQANPNVDIVVKALSNFQYHLLDVSTDYQPDGDLSLQVRLKGMNPDWQGGQPVHLNLNLEENILDLLRSLQISTDISERVRKLYQETPKGGLAK